ncbi:MAG: TIGR02996 domain-containing protein [Gemmataceae bacterium]
MTDEAALLAAVVAAPEADTPRLVLADWYDEHDDPDRAEFIRLQVRHSRLAPDEDGRPLEVRANELLGRNEERWVGPVRHLVLTQQFRRGFIEVVGVQAETFLAHAVDLFDAAPVRLAFFVGAPDQLAAVFASPHFTRLRGLGLREVGAVGAQLLAASPGATGLEDLHLFSNDIGPAGATSIARSPYLPAVKALRLGWNWLGDEGLQALAESEHLQHLDTLDVSENRVGPAGVEALARSPLISRLETLRLWHNPIGPDGASALGTSPSLGATSRLAVLNLSACQLGDAGCRSIASAPWAAGLRHLHLAGNDIAEDGVEALVDSPHLSNLAELDLGGNRLTDDDRFSLRGRFGMRVQL